MQQIDEEYADVLNQLEEALRELERETGKKMTVIFSSPSSDIKIQTSSDGKLIIENLDQKLPLQ